MKPVPNDPYAFQARVMDALIGDIRDSGAKGFPRLDALRATTNPPEGRASPISSPSQIMTETSKESFNELTSELLERMDAQLAEWLDDEPYDDWWHYQRDYRQARDTILVMQESA